MEKEMNIINYKKKIQMSYLGGKKNKEERKKNT